MIGPVNPYSMAFQQSDLPTPHQRERDKRCAVFPELVSALDALVKQDALERSAGVQRYAKGSPVDKLWRDARRVLKSATKGGIA